MNSNRVSTDLGAVVAGLLFIVAAVLLAADGYLSWAIPTSLLWPALLIGWGLTLLVRSASGQRSR